jgi:hypothetical protein
LIQAGRWNVPQLRAHFDNVGLLISKPFERGKRRSASHSAPARAISGGNQHYRSDQLAQMRPCISLQLARHKSKQALLVFGEHHGIRGSAGAAVS